MSLDALQSKLNSLCERDDLAVLIDDPDAEYLRPAPIGALLSIGVGASKALEDLVIGSIPRGAPPFRIALDAPEPLQTLVRTVEDHGYALWQWHWRLLVMPPGIVPSLPPQKHKPLAPGELARRVTAINERGDCCAEGTEDFSCPPPPPADETPDPNDR